MRPAGAGGLPPVPLAGRMQTMTERATPSVDGLVIGILGGTGDQGRGLARRFALAGHQVIIGSRSPERATAAAQEIGHGVQGRPTPTPPAAPAW